MASENRSWHAVAAEAAICDLATELHRGLTATEVAARQQRYGLNALAEAPPVPLWKKFLRQFTELVIVILLVAAVIAGVAGDWADTAAILAIVFLNAIIGFFQEERAERALAALQRLSAPMAKVLRGGQLQTVPACELVPGDVVELAAGDHVPADLRLISGFSLSIQEAALTGESVPVEKEPAAELGAATPLGDRRNMAYMGTITAAGKATAVVVAIGMETELGRIAGMLQRWHPEPTPLQRRLTELGRILVVIILAVVVVVFMLQLLRGGRLVETLLFSVSLAVAAIPEGLPAVVTIALALGVTRMVKRHALIRKLPSVETLGSVTVICSDKTGTLTRNEMTVRELFAGGVSYQVTGIGYTPRGEVRRVGAAQQSPDGRASLPDDAHATWIDAASEPDVVQALVIGARCNDSKLVPRGDGEVTWQVIGDPTEGALLVAALKAGIEGRDHQHHVLFEIPFDSERKAMSAVIREPEAGAVMYTKGAPEVILGKCASVRWSGRVEPLSDQHRQTILAASSDMAARALRVLGLAYREHTDGGIREYAESELVFAGLVGMIDPPREEAKQAVAKCHQAGIRPVMITGDHPATALAIARELHIASDSSRAVSGLELDAMNDDELARQVDLIAVYARVSAEHKLRVVQAWKARGQIVAMTGDGVNDAPAVKAADIGIAMGVTGTDVTKEASAMVLTDDNFASIVNAVEEGRGIFDNIQKSLHYLLAGSWGEVLFVFFAALVGWPFPLAAIQILWINLVTNGFPALGLAMEPPERDLMQRPPRPPQEPVVTWGRGLTMFFHGILFAAAASLGFWLIYRGDESQVAHARTTAFCIIALAEVFYSIGCRSQRYTMLEIGPFSNPHLFGAVVISVLLQLSVVLLPIAQPVFEVSAHPVREWALIFLLALAPVTIIEIAKIIRSGSPTPR